ncbi:Noc2-domain-containing protein [Basidiobolus meristosporus CBS 931.73]|uniref:Noc2-domain-containing protein n=1 Tax=Basidiobolus meristosporus CBS 931.73 TaxID=1314790 RepID=A0A1Y1XUN3_9FUNG|nr:Noc2-domain-containing protein [Basidiobolus meristosporus CBS 931.73]|eukprot:ORX89450.1 Noc2-domain-containing protein [Basidiobolus meristosporus CBS 931.73]
MAKVKKATKKFNKNHLKGAIQKRKAAQKVKAKIDKREARKQERTKNAAATPKEEEEEFDERYKDMSVDDFLNGGFEEAENESASDFDELDAVGDEEVDSEQEEPVKKGKDGLKKVGKDASKHKQELESLREKDPEFYKFLAENDKELLNFDYSDEDEISDDEIEASEDDDEEEEEEAGEQDEAGSDEDDAMEVDDSDGIVVTKEMVSNWEKIIVEQKSIRSLKKVLVAFRAAASSQDEDKVFAYKVQSDVVFNKLVIVALKHSVEIFDHHLSVKEVPEGKRKPLPSTYKKWKQLQPLVKSYLNTVLMILKQLTEKTMVQFLIQESEKALLYFACFPKLAKNYLKALLHQWGSAEESIRIVSFLAIRKLATTCPSPYLEMCLKGTYLTFVRNCQSTTIYTLPMIQLMRSCGVEVYGIDLNASYQHAFTYIRQLAIHLRNSMTLKSKESYKAVYNWQFVHCLAFWADVLGTYCDLDRVAEVGESPLQPLIYPLVQVAIGTIRLIPTHKYFPLRFHVIRALIQLGRKTGTFIPLAPHLFEVLESSEMKKKPAPSTLKALDFKLHLKVPKAYEHTRVYQDGVLEELGELIMSYYCSHALSIAFPELVLPGIVQLKRYIKRSKNVKFVKQTQQLIEKIEQNVKFVEGKRNAIDFSPHDLSKVKTFLQTTEIESSPLGAYHKTFMRLKEQRQQLLDSAK